MEGNHNEVYPVDSEAYPVGNVVMDYNLPTMTESSDVRAKRRLTLIAVTLATIPCYCIGFVAMTLAPDPSQLTPTATVTMTPSVTPTGTVPTPTPSLTPLIVT